MNREQRSAQWCTARESKDQGSRFNSGRLRRDPQGGGADATGTAERLA
jgi:hypothetical protein